MAYGWSLSWRSREPLWRTRWTDSLTIKQNYNISKMPSSLSLSHDEQARVCTASLADSCHVLTSKVMLISSLILFTGCSSVWSENIPERPLTNGTSSEPWVSRLWKSILLDLGGREWSCHYPLRWPLRASGVSSPTALHWLLFHTVQVYLVARKPVTGELTESYFFDTSSQ